ncbi:hypothetical protein Cni_G17737 [Canna indica]|uniref:Uncharacterized protein n=1 Tax=Canna indica TaxID=4628 RepID=A0AAQ3QFG0_9LILI|nr:hypothetical protein Cni_G17737 [Canna indica]
MRTSNSEMVIEGPRISGNGNSVKKGTLGSYEAPRERIRCEAGWLGQRNICLQALVNDDLSCSSSWQQQEGKRCGKGIGMFNKCDSDEPV